MSTNRLPQEVVIHIFSFVTHSTPFHNDVVDPTPPLLLGAICSSWRNLTWTTPSLWTHIYIKVSPERLEAQVELLEAWLLRTGTELPLFIVVRISDECQQDISIPSFHKYTYDQSFFASSLFEAVARVSARWKTAEIDIPSTACARCLDVVQGNIPLLQKLRIRTLTDASISISFLDGANNLTHLSLDPYIGTSFTSFSKSCANLISIFLDDLALSDIVPILTGSHHILRHFHLESLRGESLWADEPALPMLDFPNLKSLVLARTLYEGAMGRLCAIFNSIPNVEKLAITLQFMSNVFDINELLDRQGDRIHLKSLVLRLIPIDDLSDAREMGGVGRKIGGMIVPHAENLESFELEMPDMQEVIRKFLEGLHAQLESGKDKQPFSRLESYVFHVYLAESIHGGDWNDGSSRWHHLLPSLNAAKSWWKYGRGEGTGLPRSLKKVTLPDVDRKSVLRFLEAERKQGLLVEFVEPYSSEDSQPTIEWRLED